MSISSADICAAADRLTGFVGFNRKTAGHIVRFSEDSFGMDVAEDSIIPASEFVWERRDDGLMTLKRARLQLLLEQNINHRLQVGEPLLAYMRRLDLPEIRAQRRLQPPTGTVRAPTSAAVIEPIRGPGAQPRSTRPSPG